MATRTVVTTGASRGFGRVATEKVMREHPEIHLVVTARDRGGDRLASELAAVTGNANVSAVSCDLASMTSIRSATADVNSHLESGALPPLHGFIGNAGLQLTSRTHASVDGFVTKSSVESYDRDREEELWLTAAELCRVSPSSQTAE